MSKAVTRKLQGFFGGTFDPIHQGHLYIATELLQQLPFETIHLIPCNQPPHRAAPIAGPKQRLAMLKAALAGYPDLQSDPCEVQRGGLSYTVNTLRAKRAQYGKNTPLCLIVSSESFASFHHWKAFHEIIELAHLVIVQRQGSQQQPDDPTLQALLSKHLIKEPNALRQQPSGCIYISALTPPLISATEIRAALAKGDTVPTKLLSKEVAHYIQVHRLYRDSDLTCYLVGGAVRDILLGKIPKERDWVVVGQTPESMEARGYRPIGKAFPVFLHPRTHEEYALARTEKKVSKGYKGFEFYAAPDVTLVEDLKRRDLTINAMAQSPSTQEIIDPYGGQKDLEQRILRHVSDAFSEDPVRILRLARFASQLEGFTVHPKTHTLIEHMVLSGEVHALVPERIWQELQKALGSQHPERFFEVLNKCDVLMHVFSGLTLEDFDLSALAEAKKFTTTPIEIVRFAALVHKLSLETLNTLCSNLKPPKEYCKLAQLIVQYASELEKANTLDAKTLLRLFDKLDPWRRPERFNQLLTAYQAITHKEPDRARTVVKYLNKMYRVASAVSIKPLLKAGLSGEALAAAYRKAQEAALNAASSTHTLPRHPRESGDPEVKT